MSVPKPKLILAHVEKLIPNRVWKVIERTRAKHKKRWPAWCYMPFQELKNIVASDRVKVGSNLTVLATLLHLMAAWRPSQGIYRIHEGLCLELLKTKMGGAIPVEILCRLPEWCVYVELPSAIPIDGQSYLGFFAMLSFDPNHCSAPILHIGWVNDRDCALGIDYLPLIGSLQESVNAVVKGGFILQLRRKPQGATRLDHHDQQDLESRLHVALSILLYLAAANNDIRSSIGDETRPQRPLAINFRKVLTSPKVWNVGFRVGPALRNHNEVQVMATGKNLSGARQRFSVRPHVRRAHWHHFWTGSTQDPWDRNLVLKWLHPILVNVEDPDDLIPTIRNVEGSL